MSYCNVCNTDIGTDSSLMYCCHCGWPLGRLDAQTELTVPVAGNTVRFDYPVRNCGSGSLRLGMKEMPDGVTMADGSGSMWEIGPSGTSLRFQLDPTLFGHDVNELEIVFLVRDQRGMRSTDFRPAQIECTEREHRLRLRLLRQKYGPVHVCSDMLIMCRGQGYAPLRLHNQGDVPITIDIAAPKGFLIERPDGACVKSFSDVVMPGDCEIPVRADRCFPIGFGSTASIIVTVPDIPECSRNVSLVWMPDEELLCVGYSWIVGIDFGTAKTAVFISDCGLPNPDPRPVTWSMPGMTDERNKVDSVIMYPGNGGRARFGWEVPRVPSEKDVVIRSIKTRLLDSKTYKLHNGSSKSVFDVVEDYIRFILERVKEQPEFRGNPDALENALTVLSLPVHDNDGKYLEQEMIARQAAVSAGLRDEMITCYPEPECAAVDFLRDREKWGLGLEDGDLLCVFDCGAGTTDISVVEVRIDNGEPSFIRKALAGFPIGGDVLDQQLADEFIRVLQDRKQITIDMHRQIYQIGTWPATRQEIVRTLRDQKELLCYPSLDGTDAEPQSVVYEYGQSTFEITWNLIDRLFRSHVVKMLCDGFEIDDIESISSLQFGESMGGISTDRLQSLDEVLYQNGIPKSEIKWVCLTGGSSVIPCVVDEIRRFFTAATVIPSPDKIAVLSRQLDSPHVLNVARGAAIRPLCRVDGQLQSDFVMEFIFPSETKTEVLLRANSTSGASGMSKSYWLRSGEHATVRIKTTIGTVTGTVFDYPVANPTPDVISLLVKLKYGIDKKIYLNLEEAVGSTRRTKLSEVCIVQ